MQLSRADIAARIPHQGDMCLLDEVEMWDAEQIRCLSESHRSNTNPLRAHGRLASACGIEYAAQAMAVHGALIAQQDEAPRAGFLASVRNVSLHAARLDTVDGPLSIEARRFSGDGNTVMYDFSVHAAGRCLLEGRAAVVLNAADKLPGTPE